MNNQVYKCERCGKLYTLSDFEKNCKETRYGLSEIDTGLCREDRAVGLCNECKAELTDWMNRGKTRTAPAPEKKEAAPNFDELMFKAFTKEFIKYVMRTNEEKS